MVDFSCHMMSIIVVIIMEIIMIIIVQHLETLVLKIRLSSGNRVEK